MREIAKQVLRAAQLTYRVGSRPLVSEIDFALRSGEVVAMLGPNGAGKSTILKLLSGQLRPSSGTVIFGDKPLQHWPPRELARCRAVLPQHGMVPFEFSALEIVLLGRSPHGDGRSCLAMALEAMEWTECRHLAEQSVKTLSGGELRRVHLARVLVQIGLRADRSILLKDGRIAAAGTPAEVISADRIREVFGVRARIIDNPVCGTPAVFLEPSSFPR
ncbi:MAG: ATP-binding cassette domain-containing protein [Terrimicrobiaceae bacterium]